MSKELHIPSPTEIEGLLDEVMLKGISLTPSWGANLLIKPESLGIILCYSDNPYTQDDRMNQRVAEMGEGDKLTDPSPTGRQNCKDLFFFSDELKDYDWKWVTFQSLYSEKTVGFPYYQRRWQKGDVGLMKESRHASVPAYKKVWEKYISRLVFEHEGKYWAIKLKDFHYQPDLGRNLHSGPPDEPFNHRKKKEWSEEELAQDFEHSISYKLTVYMWDEMPTLEGGSFTTLKRGFGDNKKEVESYDPDSIRLVGEGIVFPLNSVWHGATLGNKDAMKHGDNHKKVDGEIVTHTGSVFVGFESISPHMVTEFKEWNIGFPMDSVTDYMSELVVIPNERDAQNTGGHYFLMRGNPTQGIINQEFMW